MSIISLPFLTLIAGLGALFFDPKKTNKKWIIIGLVISLFATFLLTIKNNIQVEAKEKRQHRIIERSGKQISDLSQALMNFREESNKNFYTTRDYLKKLSTDLTSYGWNEDKINQILESYNANKEKKILLGKIVSTDKVDTQLQYFPKDVDKKIILTHLKDLGFNLLSGTPKNQISTNAIWYSKNEVPISEVKLVALTLIQAGIKIQTIKPFSIESDNFNKQIIQVGTDKDYLNEKPFTAIQVQSAESFKR